jgi:hypothetical protein
MKIPKGYTESEVLSIIDRVVNALAPNFLFGVYDLVDIKQEGRFEALKALEGGKYDPTRDLDKFLYAHVRNRYLNLIRDKFSRNDIPCNKCPFKDASLVSGCKEFSNKSNCELWFRWNKNNGAKRSLAKPGDLSTNDDGEVNVSCHGKSVIDNVEERELMRMIDVGLPADMRSDWLKLKAGVKLSRDRTQEIERVVKGIING